MFLKYMHEQQDFRPRDLHEVFEEISDRGQHSILLLIDELVKVKPLGPPEGLLTAIGAVLDSSQKFHAMVSSLDPNVLGHVTQSSGRPITWVQLPLLSPTGAQVAFDELKYEFKVGKANRESERVSIDGCRAARSLANMCNGHPRSLEFASEVLRQYDVTEHPEAEVQSHIPFQTSTNTPQLSFCSLSSPPLSLSLSLKFVVFSCRPMGTCWTSWRGRSAAQDLPSPWRP
jgi:hypothetical protein